MYSVSSDDVNSLWHHRSYVKGLPKWLIEWRDWTVNAIGSWNRVSSFHSTWKRCRCRGSFYCTGWIQDLFAPIITEDTCCVLSGEIGPTMRSTAETVSLLSIQHERGAVAGEASTVQDGYRIFLPPLLQKTHVASWVARLDRPCDRQLKPCLFFPFNTKEGIFIHKRIFRSHLGRRIHTQAHLRRCRLIEDTHVNSAFSLCCVCCLISQHRTGRVLVLKSCRKYSTLPV